MNDYVIIILISIAICIPIWFLTKRDFKKVQEDWEKFNQLAEEITKIEYKSEILEYSYRLLSFENSTKNKFIFKEINALKMYLLGLQKNLKE